MHQDIVTQSNMGGFVLFEEVNSIQDNFWMTAILHKGNETFIHSKTHFIACHMPTLIVKGAILIDISDF